MDARTRYTINAIKNALLSLLKEKSIEKITVREICQLAEINRATFYRHFDNQYALLEILQEEMFEEIKNGVMKQAGNDEIILLVFQLVYQHKNEWLLLLGENADPRISRKIERFMADYFQVSSKVEAGKMKYRFILGGASEVFEYWVNSGMQETPEVMAEYLNRYSYCLKKA